MSKMTKILEGLINRTEEGKLKWQILVGSQEFHTSVDTISVVVRRLVVGSESISERHRLLIMNHEGVAVGALETDDELGMVPMERRATPEQARDLSRLFTLARRSALDSDSTLEKLAKSLESF